MEGGPARAFPRLSSFGGHDEHGRMEGRLFGPVLFPAVEHALAHDAHAGAVVRLALDEPLERVKAVIGTLGAAIDDTAAGLPRGHAQLVGVLACGRAQRATWSRLELDRAAEPRVQARAAGQRLPDLLGCGLDFGVGADLPLA